MLLNLPHKAWFYHQYVLIETQYGMNICMQQYGYVHETINEGNLKSTRL